MREIKEELERLNLLDKHKNYVNSQSDLQQYGWSDLELRSYQVIGLNWLLSRYYHHHGCILGDEMGLGKTCQTIACTLYLRKVESLQRPDIVICPRSVLENWRDEFKRFAPKLLVQVYTGDKIARQSLQENLTPRDSLSGYPFDVLITTYEVRCGKPLIALPLLP
ncbi:CHD1L [Acanthosepion pharaonis]|uniref:CHD1L n=1 Tax=Acanthosepion pharaonis TaxID=158019 RepID=A0A812AQX7_ACAPH|nr:CHD1L [Sepia pharaonis]